MSGKRLPSFNDFSPVILGKDLRPCLLAIANGGGNDSEIIKFWADKYFQGKANSRSAKNIPATLRSTGLIEQNRPLSLSDIGKKIAFSGTALEATQLFCAHILQHKHGDALLHALKTLYARGVSSTKKNLQEELTRSGIEGLSTATTDHTTLKNWFSVAGYIDDQDRPVDTIIKNIIGISTDETDDFESLTLGQQVFLTHIRRLHLTGDGPFLASPVIKKCLNEHPDIFDSAHFAKKIRIPLIERGWLEVTGLPSGAQGGKSGLIRGTDKLLGIPIDKFIPNFDAVIPGELRNKLKIPLAQIYADLCGEDKYKGGLALELLALRMTMDLGLDPRHFRLRSERSAHAEVDLIAEATNLMFSRWTIQCKRNAKETKVPLSDVAKEVGIAIFSKAHVVMVITTSDFSSSAREYVKEITLSQHLQFLLVPGVIVEAYVRNGRDSLIEFVRKNARNVMLLKRGQPLPAPE